MTEKSMRGDIKLYMMSTRELILCDFSHSKRIILFVSDSIKSMQISTSFWAVDINYLNIIFCNANPLLVMVDMICCVFDQWCCDKDHVIRCLRSQRVIFRKILQELKYFAQGHGLQQKYSASLWENVNDIVHRVAWEYLEFQMKYCHGYYYVRNENMKILVKSIRSNGRFQFSVVITEMGFTEKGTSLCRWNI